MGPDFEPNLDKIEYAAPLHAIGLLRKLNISPHDLIAYSITDEFLGSMDTVIDGLNENPPHQDAVAEEFVRFVISPRGTSLQDKEFPRLSEELINEKAREDVIAFKQVADGLGDQRKTKFGEDLRKFFNITSAIKHEQNALKLVRLRRKEAEAVASMLLDVLSDDVLQNRGFKRSFRRCLRITVYEDSMKDAEDDVASGDIGITTRKIIPLLKVLFGLKIAGNAIIDQVDGGAFWELISPSD